MSGNFYQVRVRFHPLHLAPTHKANPCPNPTPVQEEDCLRPGLIRKSLKTPGQYRRCGREPPRPLRSGWRLMRARYALITNWATFAQGLELPGCEQQLHLPFFKFGEVPCEMAFVFRATPTQTGVLRLRAGARGSGTGSGSGRGRGSLWVIGVGIGSGCRVRYRPCAAT